MITYTFNKEKKTTKVEPNAKNAFLYIPNAVRLILKEYTGGKEVKIGYDKVTDKAFFK